jgi:hypothetical protein
MKMTSIKRSVENISLPLQPVIIIIISYLGVYDPITNAGIM